MKVSSYALVLILIFGGCEGVGPDESKQLKDLIEKAVPLETLKPNKSERVLCAPSGDVPYTGWIKKVGENGRIEVLGEFKEGKPNGMMTSWFENGRKLKETHFVNGKVHGLEVEWYENGKKKSEGNFKYGELDALSTGWNEAGVKQWEGNFKEGKKHGSVIFYNQDGSVQSRQEWWNGREIRE